MTTSNGSTATATATSTFPVFGLATLVLFVLKVAGLAGASWGLANLSWWWVFAPILIGIGLSVLIIVTFLVIALFVVLFSRK